MKILETNFVNILKKIIIILILRRIIMRIETQTSPKNFKGFIPESTLKELYRQNTPESLKALKSCLGFNAVRRGAYNINPDKIAREIQDKFNINTEFGNNPLFAAFSALTVNIFQKLGLTQPTNIFLKDFSGTIYQNKLGICATNPYDNSLYRKFNKDFPLRSVIMNQLQNWDCIQERMLELKKQKLLSTSHFLAPFIHEFIHSAHLDNLINKYGNGSKIMCKLQKEFKNANTIALIKKETGNYASTSPCEMLAEEMTELIVDTLNDKTLMPNEMIFKMQRAKEPFNMDFLINACWNGDIAKIELFRKRKNKLIEFLKNNS